MRTQYLHLSAYPCDDCKGPLSPDGLRCAKMMSRRRLTLGRSEQFACRAGIDKARRNQALPVNFRRSNGNRQAFLADRI